MESPQPPKGEQVEDPAVERLAAETILQRGVRLKVRAPFLLRCLGKKTVSLTITMPTAGTLARISSHYLSTGLKSHQLEDTTVEQAHALMAIHGKSINRAVACAILNGYWSGKLFTRLMAWYLKWHAEQHQIAAIASMLLIYGGVSHFINTTRSVRAMKTTTPHLGQKNQGS